LANILVTGGAGYIGSATSKLISSAGHKVVIYDNLSTGHVDFAKFGTLVKGDIRETELLKQCLQSMDIDTIIHFAASAYVGESVTRPDLYYDNNVGGTMSILKAMAASGVNKIVVSSTCAVYGQPSKLPITESTPLAPINPYGASKAMMERMCWDFGQAFDIRAVALRYFNACGNEPEYTVGERHDPEPHIIPRILRTADGLQDYFEVFGNDYPTRDGTCIRDYIHVADLADAHLSAFEYLESGGESFACNLGTGKGLSVSEILEAARTVTNKDIPVKFKERRPGDPAELVADPSLALKKLNWTAKNSDIGQIMTSAWHWYNQEKLCI
jgi:UDP-arabinose 4-epimerase